MKKKQVVILKYWLSLLFLAVSTHSALAAPAHVSSCNTTLHAAGNYILTQNLSCNGTAITITGNNVILNLNGLTIAGTNGGNGIYVNGVSGAQICSANVPCGQTSPTKDAITGFDIGVNLNAASNSVISNLNIHNNITGVGYGIYLTHASSGNAISQNTISNNGDKGIYLDSASNNNGILGNMLSHNGYTSGFGDGIRLEACNYNNLIGNISSNNKQDGIGLRDSNNSMLQGNIANYNSRNGIFLRNLNFTNANNYLLSNIAEFNNWSGIYLGLSATNNRVTNNIAEKNNQGHHHSGSYTDAGDPNPLIAGECANYWYRNIFLTVSETTACIF